MKNYPIAPQMQNLAYVSITQAGHLWTAQLIVLSVTTGDIPTIQTWTGYPKYVEQRLARALDKLYDVGVTCHADPLKPALSKVKR